VANDILYPLRRLHGAFYEFRLKCKTKNHLRKESRKFFKNHPKAVFLILTPEHGNLGDHAIALAETELLKQRGIDYFEISGKKLNEMMQQNLLHCLNGFPILINGGGNLGTLWMNVEILERTILKNNPESPVFVLPNTIFYEKNDWGQEELQESIRIYNSHKYLKLYARERISYDIMKPIYRDVQLVPDMVLSLKKDGYGIERKGCLLCLRSDREKTRTQEQEAVIRQQTELLFGERVSDTDMVAGDSILIAERESELEKKFRQFAGSELVITDRLHGMIFCAITGTPCIVIDSKSPKVKGCYEWIKHLDYIRFAENPENIVAEFRAIPKGPHHYDNSHLMQYFQTLGEDIENIWR